MPEAKPLDCPICKEAEKATETFADQLEREMEEAREAAEAKRKG